MVDSGYRDTMTVRHGDGGANGNGSSQFPSNISDRFVAAVIEGPGVR